MASEIKIHLATYLKDAGIKATEAQVEKLAKSVQNMNRKVQSDTDSTIQKLGRLPGVFGTIQKLVGGFGATASAVIAGFKIGWDIGSWLNDKVIRPLFNIKDPLEELKKHNRELKRQAEEAAEKWTVALDEWARGWEKEVRGAERARQEIEDLAQAYLKMQEARERVRAVGDDAKMLGLQRDKFEDMLYVGTNGTAEQAAQVGKYYDVLIAMESKKKELAKLDRQAEESANRQWLAEEERDKAADKAVRLKQQLVELDKKIGWLGTDAADEELGPKRADKEERAAKRRRDALQKELDAAERDVEKRRVELEAMEESRSAEAQERENAKARADLEIDEKKKAYDDYCKHIEEEDAKRVKEAARKAAEMELQERQKAEQQLAAQRITDLRKELTERQRLESEALSRQNAAAGSLQTAWGWYRNQSQMQAVIDEQKAQAAAEVQWQKDFERLKTWRRDWRTADFGSLSAADEAVRQVAFAKEEKAEADRAVIETAENTRDLAEKLDELLQMK